MAWNKSYRLWAIGLHTVGMSSEVILAGVANASIAANSDVLRETVAGSLYAETASLQKLAPQASFETFSLKDAIDNVGLGGAGGCITSDGTHPGIKFYFAEWECNGPKTVGGTHLVFTVKQGILVPRSLTVEHRGNAQLAYDLFAAFDGTNAPVVQTTTGTLPTQPNNTGRWTMHTMTTPGSSAAYSIEGKRNIAIQFNPRTSSEGADSTEYDTVVSLDSLLQQVKVNGVDPNWFSNANVGPLVGKSVASTLASPSFSFVLRKRNTPNATAQHILIAATGLINWDQIVGGTPDRPASTSFNLDCTKNVATGDNPILANTAYAIP